MSVETHPWVYWAMIAFEQHRAADEARERSAVVPLGPGCIDLVDLELRGGLVSISASAHAIDGFYGAVKPLVPIDQATTEAWERKGTSRPMRIIETLKRGFDVGPQVGAWTPELRWLYGLRDAAVHSKPRTESFAPHPSGMHLAEINQMYSASEAARALALAIDIMRSCLARPRAANAPLVAWADEPKRSALETAVAPRSSKTPRAIVVPNAV